MKLKDQLESQYQGLPGLGVNGKEGEEGRKGRSIYIGHVKDFFDNRQLTEEELVYIRVKLQEEYPDTYFLDSSFFYRDLQEDIDQMTTFSIKNAMQIDASIFIREYQRNTAGKYVPKQGYGRPLSLNVFNLKLDPDYLALRERNQGKTNYNKKYTEDVIIPTNLSNTYQEGDILYILDDETDNIIMYIIVSPDMLGCTFDYFLKKEFTKCSSLISAFTLKNDRVRVMKDLVLADVSINKALIEGSDERAKSRRYISNFISKNALKDYPFSIMRNEEKGLDAFSLMADTNTFSTSIRENGSIEWTGGSVKCIDAVLVSPTSIQAPNLYLKNVWSNVNIPEYNTDDIIFIDSLHVSTPRSSEVKVVDESDIQVTISYDRFFNTISNTFRYGIEVYDIDSKKVLDKMVDNPDLLQVNFSSKIKEFPDGKSIYKIISFVEGEGIARYYSYPSQIDINYSRSQKKILSHTYSEADVSDILTVSDGFTFSCDEVKCEETKGIELIISTEKYNITEIYVNNRKVVSTNQPSISSWCKLTQSSVTSKEAVLVFDVSSNFATVEGRQEDVPSLYEYLRKIGSDTDEGGFGVEIGEHIVETQERTFSIIVFGTDPNGVQGNSVNATYSFTQPGFKNPLQDIPITLTHLTRSNNLEDSNRSDAGVLCNQLQIFTEVGISGFDNEIWGTYLKDPTLEIYVELDSDIAEVYENKTYFNETNINNFHAYSKESLREFKNNAVRMDFSWIPNDTEISFDSSLSKMSEIVRRHRLEWTASIPDRAIQLEAHDGWIRLDSSIFTSIDSMSNPFEGETPLDINYSIIKSLRNGENCIDGITFDMATNSKKIKIRTLAEIANPIPCEMNFRWKVWKIAVRGHLKDEYTRSEDELVFTKRIGFISKKTSSSNLRLIVNPVSMTAAPISEESSISPILGAIKKTGSEDNVKIKVGIEDLPWKLKSEYAQKGYEDIYSRYKVYGMNPTYQNRSIPDIASYYPKKKYLQDNVQSLYISPRSLKKEINENVLDDLDSSFISLTKRLSGMASSFQNFFNIYLIDLSEKTNIGSEKDLLCSWWNVSVMNPEKRDNDFNFYYNDKLYDADKYNQWNHVSPLLSEESADIRLIDSSMHLSRRTWNFEYEVNDAYVDSIVSGGLITKSGNGYVFAKDVEGIDQGQYASDGLLGVKETYEAFDVSLLNVPHIQTMASPASVKLKPNDNELFRSFLFDMSWIYPNFVTYNDNVNLYPYYMVNSYVAYQDSRVMKMFIDAFDTDNNLDMKSFIRGEIDGYDTKSLFAGEESVTWTDSISSVTYTWNEREESFNDYIEHKIEDHIFTHSDAGGISIENSTSKINMLVPYNVLYNLYPRVLANTDANCINVLMLQEPTISDETSYALKKHYFSIGDGYYKKENPSDTDGDILEILPPWNYDYSE